MQGRQRPNPPGTSRASCYDMLKTFTHLLLLVAHLNGHAWIDPKDKNVMLPVAVQVSR